MSLSLGLRKPGCLLASVGASQGARTRLEQSPTHLHANSPTRSLIPSFTHPPVHPLICTLIHLPAHPPMPRLTHSFTYSPLTVTHPFIRLLMYSFTPQPLTHRCHSQTQSLFHSFIHPFIHSLPNSPTHPSPIHSLIYTKSLLLIQIQAGSATRSSGSQSLHKEQSSSFL